MTARKEIIEKLALGDVAEAMTLAQDTDTAIYNRIKESISFLESAETYKEYYSSDFEGIEKRIPGLFADAEPDMRQRYMLDHISKIKHGSVLDVGCADGSFIFKINRSLQTESLFGVDVWENGVKFAKTKANSESVNAEFKQGMFEEIEFDRTFDVIVFGEILEHVIDPTEMLKKAKTLLNDNGRIVATVPVGRPPVTPEEEELLLSGKPNQHVRYFTEKKFIETALNVGLIPEKTDQEGQSWKNLIVTLRTL